MHWNQHLHLECVKFSSGALSHQEVTPATSKPKFKSDSLSAMNHTYVYLLLFCLWRSWHLIHPEYISCRTIYFGGHYSPGHSNWKVLMVRIWFSSTLGKSGICFWTHAAFFFEWDLECYKWDLDIFIEADHNNLSSPSPCTHMNGIVLLKTSAWINKYFWNAWVSSE